MNKLCQLAAVFSWVCSTPATLPAGHHSKVLASRQSIDFTCQIQKHHKEFTLLHLLGT